MINDDVKSKKDFILISLTTPMQVNPDMSEIEKFKMKNNINDIFYPEKRLSKFSKKIL